MNKSEPEKTIKKGKELKNGFERTRGFTPLHKRSKAQKRRQIIVELVFLVVLAVICAYVVYRDYQERPGLINTEDFRVTDRGTDSLTIGWKEIRNTDHYNIYYKKRGDASTEWECLKVKNSEDEPVTSAVIEGLEEGAVYSVMMRADNDDREGFESGSKQMSTRKTQKIRLKKKTYTKLRSSAKFKLNAKAETELSYKSSNSKVVKVSSSGKVTVKGAGKATITIKAAENSNYTGASEKVKVHVLDSKAVKSAGASAHIIHYLDESNCTKLFSVKRGGTPQSFAYTGDTYIVAYNGGSNGVATFSNVGRILSTAGTSALGHANGFTYCHKTKRCYGMRGNSHQVDIYNPKTKEFGATSVFCSASGIAYDRVKKVIYMSSRTGIRVFSGDGKFTHKKLMANCSHAGYVYTQDCGGHAGIVMRCMSGPNKHVDNYIDLYRVSDETYLGSLYCDIGEVESAVVDDNGFLVLLINSANDYIWRTDINIEDLAE